MLSPNTSLHNSLQAGAVALLEVTEAFEAVMIRMAFTSDALKGGFQEVVIAGKEMDAVLPHHGQTPILFVTDTRGDSSPVYQSAEELLLTISPIKIAQEGPAL